jgi:hypothetical protein
MKPIDGHVSLDGMYSYDFLTEIPLIRTRISFLDVISDATSETQAKMGPCRSEIRETGLTVSR